MTQGLETVLAVRVVPADVEQVDALAAKLDIKRGDVMRRALRLGLAALARDPTLFFSVEAMPPPPAARKRKR
jgi:hypothetical protein